MDYVERLARIRANRRGEVLRFDVEDMREVLAAIEATGCKVVERDMTRAMHDAQPRPSYGFESDFSAAWDAAPDYPWMTHS